MFVVAALYKFTHLDDHTALQQPLQQLCQQLDVRGTLLLAHEGINGTVAGTRSAIDDLLAFIRSDPRLGDIEVKESSADEQPFLRMKVRLKKEIVTLGRPEADPNVITGTFVEPEDWNDVINDPDVVLVDTRNEYEVAIGTFEGALDPHTESFREFPEYVQKNLDPTKHKRVAMFCTGGIRCEKASSLMLQMGFEEVLQLRGGILKYLERIPQDNSTWNGHCYVFDRRIAVGHGLEISEHTMCFSCGRPLSPEDCEHEKYEAGVCCHYCDDALTDEQRAAFRERQRQMVLAHERGETHLGDG